MNNNSMRKQENVNKLICLMLDNRAPEVVYTVSNEGVTTGMILITGVKECQRFIEHYNNCK